MCCNGCPAFNNRVMYQNHSGKLPGQNAGADGIMGDGNEGDVTATECKNCLTSALHFIVATSVSLLT